MGCQRRDHIYRFVLRDSAAFARLYTKVFHAGASSAAAIAVRGPTNSRGVLSSRLGFGELLSSPQRCACLFFRPAGWFGPGVAGLAADLVFRPLGRISF